MAMVRLEGCYNVYINPAHIETISSAEDLERGLIVIHTVSGDNIYWRMSEFPGFSDINEFLKEVTLALCHEVSSINLTEFSGKDAEEKG